MTGLSDDDRPDDGRPDPLDALLRPAIEFLPVPPGSFERIRRTAARRRRVKAAAAGGLTLAAVAGSLYLGGVFRPPGETVVVTPPASSGSLAPGPSGSSSGASPTPSVGVPAPSSSGPTGPASSAGSTGTQSGRGATGTATTPRAPVSTPMCATSQLTASLGSGDAGAGNLYRYLLLTNHSATSCHLTGYPGLSMLDVDGKQIGAPATKESLTYNPVVLAPGASASDTIHTANRQTTSSTECLPTSVNLRIYPPGNKASLVFPGQVSNCDDTFSVTPFIAGSSGNPPA
jgi:hypothetical protein